MMHAQFKSMTKVNGITRYLELSGAIFFTDDVGMPLVSFINRNSSLTIYTLELSSLSYEAIGVAAYAYRA